MARFSRCYEIMGKAYVDTLSKATGKTLKCISEELGYSPTFMKNIGLTGKIRIGVADMIEHKYGISVNPYIVPEPTKEPESEWFEFDVDELAERIKSTIVAYLTEKEGKK